MSISIQSSRGMPRIALRSSGGSSVLRASLPGKPFPTAVRPLRAAGTQSRAEGVDEPFDVCVVGGGLTGAAAARYLSQRGLQVAAVAPPEPPRSAWGNKEIFGAHYDEGRITRKTDPDPVWALLAQRSIDRYPDIEKESGIHFYHEIGHLTVGPVGSPSIESRLKNATDACIEHSLLDAESLRTEYPYLNFPGENAAVQEVSGAGWVSARKQVAAQMELAARSGCVVVPEEAVSVHQANLSDCDTETFSDNPLYAVEAASGHSILARKVLVSAGAFTNYRGLLPGGPGGSQLKLELQLMTAQTVKLQLSREDAANLSRMPSIIFKGEDYWVYILPPIEYPDGKIYLKVGGGSAKTPPPVINGKVAVSPSLPGKHRLQSHQDVIGWYRSGGDEQAAQDLLQLAETIIPGIKPVAWYSDACVTCHTPTNQAYVGPIAPQDAPGLFVLTGGNGVAAKSADELGRMAAEAAMADDGWGKQDFSREIFAPRLTEMHTTDVMPDYYAPSDGMKSKVV